MLGICFVGFDWFLTYGLPLGGLFRYFMLVVIVLFDVVLHISSFWFVVLGFNWLLGCVGIVLFGCCCGINCFV